MTAEKSSWLKGNLDIRTRDDGSGGNITVAADAEIGGDLRVEGGVVLSDGSALSPSGIDRSLLPLATGEDPGAVTVGAGLAVEDGLVSWAPQYKTLGGESLVSGGGAYICVEANALEIDTGGSEAVIRVKVKSSGGIAKSASGLAADKSALQTILELTAAARTELAAGTGTAADSGKIPLLDGAGKVPLALIPAQALGDDDLGTVANAEGMTALFNATCGDYCFRLDTGTYYRLGSRADGAYADESNWHEFAGAVTSVNGKRGEVQQSDLGLETALTVGSNTKFPSSRAVAVFVDEKISDLKLDKNYVSAEAFGEYQQEVEDTCATKEDLEDYAESDHQHVVVPEVEIPASGIIEVTESTKIAHYKKTVTGDCVIGVDFSGVGSANRDATVELRVLMPGTLHSVQFAGNIVWLNDDEPLFTRTNKTYIMAFRTYDGGNTVIGSYQGII